MKENENHKSHTAVRGASLEFEDYSRTLPVHSLLNPLIDDRGGKMTNSICLFITVARFISGERGMGGHPCFMGQYAVINNN